jgi:hypothetical protein
LPFCFHNTILFRGRDFAVGSHTVELLNCVQPELSVHGLVDGVEVEIERVIAREECSELRGTNCTGHVSVVKDLGLFVAFHVLIAEERRTRGSL